MADTDTATKAFIESLWDKSVVPTLEEYIRIPNQSPLFDKEWETNGLMDKAADILISWVKKQNIKGLTIEKMAVPGRTCLIFVEVAATNPSQKGTVMLYGHMDKQPPMTETWEKKFGGPSDPKIIDGKLYGRGGADDGYSICAAIGGIAALQAQGIAHGRCVITIESCEESQSLDLPYYMDQLKEKIGVPDVIVCLDSGCGTYDQLWLTSSLRGMVLGVLTVEILTEGVHSGKASGIVPSSFRIMRQLLSRLEDEKTGKMLVNELQVEIPPNRVQEAIGVCEELGDEIANQFPFVPSARADSTLTNDELLLNATWRPTLSVTACGGMPAIESAGNVLRQKTSLCLSIRLPPTANADAAGQAVKKELEREPPYGAKVAFDLRGCGPGWNMPPMSDWLEESLKAASMSFYGKPLRMQGEGGSIPFMGMLAEKFPKAQFVVTGVLGPNSNAHGPNEFLDIKMGKAVTYGVAKILAAHQQNMAK